MNKFLKNNLTKLIILCLLIFVIIGYKCYAPNKEYFVFKLGAPGREILLDQNDFASVINGLKPKSVAGTFTTDDLSELVRELKGLWVANASSAYNNVCKTDTQKASQKCILMNNFISLIHETNEVKYEGNPVTSKEVWLNAIIDTALNMYPAAKPTEYTRVNNNVIKAINERRSVRTVLDATPA